MIIIIAIIMIKILLLLSSCCSAHVGIINNHGTDLIKYGFCSAYPANKCTWMGSIIEVWV